MIRELKFIPHVEKKVIFFPFFDCKAGRTSLMWACAGGYREVVEVLIAAKANVDIQDKVRGGG